MLAPQTIATIKQTIPVLTEHGETLTRHFYKRMFTHNPEVQTLFNPAHQHTGSQQKALAGAICAYAQHIENPDALADALELIAQKHASLQIQPKHYPIVGKHLLASIREVLGDAATEEIIDAWGQAYQVLADVLISRETQLYADHEQQHGWQGLKTFTVQKKQSESDVITSFYLVPADGEALPWFQPGQYITVRVPGQDGHSTMRNYSLSCHPGEPYYRISVKRESSTASTAPDGHVSNYLHDRIHEGDSIEVGPPCGDFVLDMNTAADRPLVLISGGVGITPVLSMLHAALELDTQRDIWFIHGAINSQTHAFAAEVRALAMKHPRLHVHICYSEPTSQDRQQAAYDSEGFIDLVLLTSLLDGPNADFYFCGPKPLLVNLYQGLFAWGVEETQLNCEFFGPAEELQAPAATACPFAEAH